MEQQDEHAITIVDIHQFHDVVVRLDLERFLFVDPFPQRMMDAECLVVSGHRERLGASVSRIEDDVVGAEEPGMRFDEQGRLPPEAS